MPDIVEESEKRAFCPDCERQFDAERKYCPDDGALLLTYDVVDVARDDPMIGQVLDDRFRIEEPLSEGGMGKVYLGSQMGVDRRVAIKILSADPSDGEASVRRFLREAHTLSNFTHPNIVNFIDFGQDAERRALYLVMEMIEGCDLGQLLQRGRLRVDLAVEIALQLCAALTEPHEHGFVHRDLKPANVMLLPLSDGSLQVKLVDFGIADAVDGETKVTKTGAVIGTPNYMAPEQAENSDVTPSSDIYSVGALLYHMLAGAPMFEARNDLQLIFKHVQEEAPSLDSLPNHGEIPDGLRKLFRRLVAKEPEQRPGSILEVRRELLEIARSSQIGGIHLDPSLPIEEALAEWVLPDDDAAIRDQLAAESDGDESHDSPREGSEFDVHTQVGFGPRVHGEEAPDDGETPAIEPEDAPARTDAAGSTETRTGETQTEGDAPGDEAPSTASGAPTGRVPAGEESDEDAPAVVVSKPDAPSGDPSADRRGASSWGAAAAILSILIGSGAMALWLTLSDERPEWLEPTVENSTKERRNDVSATSSSPADGASSDGGRAAGERADTRNPDASADDEADGSQQRDVHDSGGARGSGSDAEPESPGRPAASPDRIAPAESGAAEEETTDHEDGDSPSGPRGDDGANEPSPPPTDPAHSEDSAGHEETSARSTTTPETTDESPTDEASSTPPSRGRPGASGADEEAATGTSQGPNEDGSQEAPARGGEDLDTTAPSPDAGGSSGDTAAQ